MILSTYNVITGQQFQNIDVSKIDISTLEELLEVETWSEPEYYTNKDVFENDGSYAEDDIE